MENVIKTKCLESFKKDLQNDKISHAYLVISPDELFNKLVAIEMASFLLCENKSFCEECLNCKKTLAGTNPDLHIFPKSKNFLVDDAVAVIEKSYESPMIGNKKVFIINNIDLATFQAQNKILKTLEEPTQSNMFILTATNENKILQTVVSRTRKEYLLPLQQDEVKSLIDNAPENFKDLLPQRKNYIGNELFDAVSFGEGWIGKTFEALESKHFSEQKILARKIINAFSSSKEFAFYCSSVLKFKDEIPNFLQLLENEARNNLKEDVNNLGYLEIIEEIQSCYVELERNVNVNLIVDNLLMKILEIKYNNKLN